LAKQRSGWPCTAPAARSKTARSATSKTSVDFQFSFSKRKRSCPTYASPAGGIDASVKRISDVTGSIDLRHFSADNLALALWGTTAVLSATPIVAEAGYKIVPLMFIPTKRLINTSVAPVVKKGATTVLAADYTVSAGGITIAAPSPPAAYCPAMRSPSTTPRRPAMMFRR
jgi:hypothetical protein